MMTIEWTHIQTGLTIIVPFFLWALGMKIKNDVKSMLDEENAKIRKEFEVAFASSKTVVALEAQVDKRFNSMEVQLGTLAKREDIATVQADMRHVMKSIDQLLSRGAHQD
jgi:hypothetical protein